MQTKIRTRLVPNKRIPLCEDVNQLSQRSTMVLLKSSLHFGVLQNVKGNGRSKSGAGKGFRNRVWEACDNLCIFGHGSNSTFCTEDLLNQLGLKGEEPSFSLFTIEKQNSKVKCSVVSLVVYNLQENEFIDLPSVFPTPALPITCDNIPKQEDVKRWPKKVKVKCAVHRTITLISHASKVTLKILQKANYTNCGVCNGRLSGRF